MGNLRPDLHAVLKPPRPRSAVASRISSVVVARIAKRQNGLGLHRFVSAPVQAPLPAKMLLATSSPALLSSRKIGLKEGGAAPGSRFQWRYPEDRPDESGRDGFPGTGKPPSSVPGILNKGMLGSPVPAAR